MALAGCCSNQASEEFEAKIIDSMKEASNIVTCMATDYYSLLEILIAYTVVNSLRIGSMARASSLHPTNQDSQKVPREPIDWAARMDKLLRNMQMVRFVVVHSPVTKWQESICMLVKLENPNMDNYLV